MFGDVPEEDDSSVAGSDDPSSDGSKSSDYESERGDGMASKKASSQLRDKVNKWLNTFKVKS